MKYSLDEIKRMTDWFSAGKYGIMIHFLGDYRSGDEEWDARVNAFDCEGLAKQLHEIGAKHFLFTISQGGGRFPFPNENHSRNVREYGIHKKVCSDRDLIGDLYDALSKYGISLMLYAPFECPMSGEMANIYPFSNVTGHTEACKVKWLAIIREISLRYGKKVKGWWIDGCGEHYPEFATKDTEYANDLRQALQAGNSDSILSFNPGIIVKRISDHQQFTCGEANEWCFFPEGRFIDGIQWHVLTYLGPWWTDRVCAHSNKELVNYVKACTDKGGVLTFDIAYDEHGHIQPEHFEQLKVMKHFIRDVDSFTGAEIPESESYLATLGLNEKPDDIPAGAVNIALNKPCIASSCFSDGFKPGNAVDGDTETGWALGRENEGNIWWQLDLGEICDIDGIELVVRNFNNNERRNFELRASIEPDLQDYTVLLHQGDFPYPMRRNWAKVYDKPVRARFIKLVPIGRWYMPYISELRVYQFKKG